MMENLGILFLRVSAGLFMLIGHGYGKLVGFSAMKDSFPDPIGLGSMLSLVLVIFAEFFCALAVTLGFKTRWASIPLTFNMLVAGLIFHANDPWAKQEFALLYVVPFFALIFLGSGSYSLDALICKKKKE